MGDIVPMLGDAGKLWSIQIWLVILILIHCGRHTTVLGDICRFWAVLVVSGKEYT